MRRIFLLAVLSFLVLMNFSCSVGNDGGTNPEQGYILMANVSPNSPPLNTTMNGSDFNQGLSFGVYMPYYGLTAGSYTVAFTDASNTAVLSNSITLEANKTYSYILIDSFSKIKSTFFEDKLVAPGMDSIQLRFFNFSPNSQPFNLRDSATGKVYFKQRSFNDQAFFSNYTTFIGLPAGTYTFQLQMLNADSTIVASKVYNLEAGHVFSLFAKGFVGGAGAQALDIGKFQNY